MFQKFAPSGNPISKPFRVMFMVRGLCADYGKLLLDFRDGTKEFKKEDMGSITTWCKSWDEEDTFANEYKTVFDRKTHKKVKPPPTASVTGTNRAKDPLLPIPLHGST